MAGKINFGVLPQKILDAIGNLHRPLGAEVHSVPPGREFLDMNAIPVPDRRLADPRYYERYGIDSIQTKRGCPLLCDYCTYPIIEGRVGRARQPAAIVDEMFAAVEVQPGIRHFFIVDSVFNLPRTHAKQVCRELIARDWKLPWTCYANPLGFDAEMAELSAAAGCAGMEIGSDSGVNDVLARLRKGFTTQQIRNLHQIAAQVDIPDCHAFILGTPGETFDDVLRTLDFIVDLDPFSAILMAWVDDAEALDSETAREREKLRESIMKLLEEHKSEFPWWSIPALGVNYDPRLFALLRSNGYNGPLWRHIRALVPAATENHRPRGGVGTSQSP